MEPNGHYHPKYLHILYFRNMHNGNSTFRPLATKIKFEVSITKLIAI